jgi:hypothetical protein
MGLHSSRSSKLDFYRGPIVGRPNREPPNWGRAEKFGRPTKTTAHLKSLLDINFLYPPSKYENNSSFSSPAKIALRQFAARPGVDCTQPMEGGVASTPGLNCWSCWLSRSREFVILCGLSVQAVTQLPLSPPIAQIGQPPQLWLPRPYPKFGIGKGNSS